VVTRRAVLGGAAVALLAGCGDEARMELPRPSDALLRQLAAERRLTAAARGAGGRVAARVASRSARRAGLLAAAVSSAGGRPHDAPAPAGGGEDVVARARAALEAHVVALPALPRPRLRALGAELVTGAATDLAMLRRARGAPPDGPFPGTPR
jgi:hypothetical protein